MITIKHKGDLKRTKQYLYNAKGSYSEEQLNALAKKNLQILKDATPSSTGNLASKWDYEIVKTKNGNGILFTNSDVQNGINIAILVDRGHGTKNGNWVSGKNYIDPAIREIYEKIIRQTWEEMNNDR